MNWMLMHKTMLAATQVLRHSPLLSLRQYRAICLRPSIIARNLSLTSSHRSTTQKADLRSVDHDVLIDLRPENLIPIRERLRIWEENHRDDVLQSSLPKSFDFDIANLGALDNSVTRPSEGIRLQEEEEDAENVRMVGKESLADFGDRRPFLLQGDMVDLVFHGGQKSELAVFVRDFETTSQFYTMSGRWVHRKPRSVLYYVPGFIKADELSPLLPYLPAEDVVETDKDTLHGFETALPREIGAHIVSKMRAFCSEADAVYRSSAHRLDHAHKLVAHEDNITYASVEELSEILLADTVKRDSQGRLPESAVYAVYRVLAMNDQAFRPTNTKTHRVTGQLEISSLSESRSVTQVSQWVRDYQHQILLGSGTQATSGSFILQKFLQKARAVIDRNRKTREPTKFGVIGPCTVGKDVLEGLIVHRDLSWNYNDMQILMFIESWAALRSFKAHSILNSIGSYLLRLIDRFPDHALEMSTAWQFLQEIGFITPWATRAPFDARLPYEGNRLRNTLEFPGFDESTFQVHDAMSEYRRDWGDMPVYCIDDVSAHEIDDGVSIEAIESSPDEHWVHIHTADPASIIEPNSPLGLVASDVVGNIYMPDRVRTMLPQKTVIEHMSLAPNRRTLTFSARMGEGGRILESKISSGIIRNVKFISPDTVMEAIGRSPKESPLKTIVQVGPQIEASSNHRHMTPANGLTNSDVQNLQLLDKYGNARAAIQSSKGDVSIHWPQPKISVRFPKTINDEWLHHEATSEASLEFPSRSYNYDPSITLTSEHFNPRHVDLGSLTVKNLMGIASEVVGQWCTERNIPIIYRATPHHPDRQDPTEFYQTVMKPAADKDGYVPLRLRLEYLRLLGGAKQTTTPAPHVALGLSRYTRVTSPLRRFGDLLAHWQIQAALREEARSGESLVGSTREDYLPFSKAELESMIPRLEAKESQISIHNNDGDRQWATNLLVRAWQFKESKLPKTFDVFVIDVTTMHKTTMVSGFLVDLGIFVQFDVPDWTTKNDVQFGDIFECEIEDVQSYTRRIIMKPLSKKKTVGQDGYEP